MSAVKGERTTESLGLGRLSADNLDRLSASLEALRLLGRSAGEEEAGERTFGRFRLRQVLGQGKFGVVFLADDPQSGREVALKLPQPEVLVDPVLGERFRRDAEAAGALDHPGIVPVLEAGNVGAAPYLVMPYVPGPTLAAWLGQRTGPAPVADAVDLALALAEAVQHAHERGVLHCDLKPANVLLRPCGPGAPEHLRAFHARITDFGLARLLNRDPEQTRTHLTAGTPPYMAPEQAMGARRDLTARCDVHALAAILYELLTGQRPYAAPEGDEMIRGLLDPQTVPVPPRRLRPDVPGDLEAIVLKGLEKPPEARYAGAGELADDLHRFRHGRPTRARPVGSWGRAVRWARRHPVVAMLLACCVGTAGLAAWMISRDVRHHHELEMASQAAELHQFHAVLERVRQRRAERPEGWVDDNLADIRHLSAHPAAAGLQPDLCSEAAAALAAPRLELLRELGPGKNAYVCAFSPDGRTVALGERYPVLPSKELRVWLTRVATGQVTGELRYPVDLAWEKRHGNRRADGARSLSYSPDGRWLVLGTRGGRLVRWPLGEPAPRAVAWPAQPAGEDDTKSEVRSLLFSEDGAVLVSGSMGQVISRWSVREGWSLTGRVRGLLPIGTPTAREATWAWADKAEPTLFRWDLRTGAVRNEVPSPGVYAFGVTPDGEALVGSTIEQGVNGWQFLPAFPGLRRPLIRPNYAPQDEDVKDLAFTPDGRFFLQTDRAGVALDLWDAVRGTLVAKARLGGGSARLAVSPSGRFVAVCTNERTLLFRLALGAAHRSAVAEGGEVRSFALSADGRRLATFRTRGLPRAGGGWLSPLTLYARRAEDFRQEHRLRVAVHGVIGRHVALAPHGDLSVVFQASRAGPGLATLSGRWVSTGYLNDLQFGPDSRAWAAEGPYLAWWSGKEPKKQTVHEAKPWGEREHDLTTVVPGPGGVVAGLRDGRLLRFERGRLAAAVPVFSDQEVSSLAVSADGSEAFAGGSLGAVARVALPSNRVTFPAAPHRDAVNGAAYLPDGTAITASADHTIRFRDKHDRVLLTLRQGGPVARVAITRDGRELFTLVEREWGVRVWALAELHRRLVALGLSPGWSVTPAAGQALPPDPARGLLAEYFDDRSFGWLAHRRIDPQAGLAPTKGLPSPWLTTPEFSARWTGYLQAPHAGRWELQVDAKGPVALWLDGRAITGPTAAEVALPATPVSVRLDYVSGETARCRLLWRLAGSAQPFVDVPSSALSPCPS